MVIGDIGGDIGGIPRLVKSFSLLQFAPDNLGSEKKLKMRDKSKGRYTHFFFNPALPSQHFPFSPPHPLKNPGAAS